jgi:hypothetical protein
MGRDSFTHDDAIFEPETAPGGKIVSSEEAKYAELFAEVIWDGVISPEARYRLDTAASMFGLEPKRAAQIEEALVAAHNMRHRMQVVEEELDEDTRVMEPPISIPISEEIAPIAPSEDPGVRALQHRIGHLEEGNDALTRDNYRLRDQLSSLENLVLQLQFALEQTMEELDEERTSVLPNPLHSGAVANEAPPPAVSMTQPRSQLSSVDAVTLEEIHAQVRAPRENPAELHRRLRRQPRDPPLLRALYRSLGRGVDVDRRWCISHALVFLGEANDEETALFHEHRDEHLVRPRRAVNDDEWRELLFHPAEDELTGEILSAIAPAVLLGQMTAIRASIAPAVLDPELRVDPKRSTLQAVRCLSWAAEFLGLNVPPIYVCPEHDGSAEIVLNPVPATKLGRIALAGRTSKELAFLAGRHLSWYRREHLLGKPTRSVRRLEDMFLAALMIGNPGLPLAKDIKERVEPIVSSIRPLLSGEAVEKLQHCFSRFVEFGGRTNLRQWMRGAERTADCSGMLLANDLWAARDMLHVIDSSLAEVAIDDLICFITADRYTMLRQRISIAVGVQ